MKPIEEWFDTIPEPARTYAYKILSQNYTIDGTDFSKVILKTPKSSLVDALFCSFDFMDTPQGVEYWIKVSEGKI
jgi:hypothetical protein